MLATVLANRKKSVISSVVGPTQAYGIPGRDILDTILTVKYTLQEMQRVGGIYLGLDFNKSLDRVEDGFMWEVLDRFGLGHQLIQCLKLLYNNAQARIRSNGTVSSPFHLGRSIWQGCPFSALLYSLVAEPLANALNKNQLIKGTDRASGAKVNTKKSMVMYCGEEVQTPGRWDFQHAEQSVRVLGVQLGVKQTAARDAVWERQLQGVTTILGLWRMRDLTLNGKVVVTNALVMSRLNHAMAVYDLPSDVVTKLDNSRVTFLWKSSRNLVAHKTLIWERTRGGLNLVDLKSKNYAFKIKLIRKFLDPNHVAGWKDFFGDVLSSLGPHDQLGRCQVLKKTHTAV
ncbi:unnamed protein product [Menidia menidia]|uniref:(Atlantic silverside) hypothetical protein n=1 Tax=Menidia menidia TaxID=238744 RepID=A0A8S4BQI8_9TELE|nr:unnamed protein product [Menidia menidia]